MTREQALATLATLAASIDPDEPSILAARCTCPAELCGGAAIVCETCDPVAHQKATARRSKWGRR